MIASAFFWFWEAELYIMIVHMYSYLVPKVSWKDQLEQDIHVVRFRRRVIYTTRRLHSRPIWIGRVLSWESDIY